MESVLGEGSFGMVYRAWWKGTLTAVKRMVFPAGMSGAAKREKMAIMETAISARLRHPNIVQLYAFYLRPLAGEAAGGQGAGDSYASLAGGSDGGADVAGAFLAGDDAAANFTWEVRLVLEYCDRGNLRTQLDAPGAFLLPDGSRDMLSVVSCALDVAKAMLHLHSVNVLHSDLKACNVLLKTASVDDSRGYVAKVADFGLSLQLGDGGSHVEGVFQGTMSHMAPEVMTSGRVSKASDVYTFGILLWELFTGKHAFKGVPPTLLGHEVAYQQRRPQFPEGCPFDYQLLACRCWESDYAIRPDFDAILQQLQRMRGRLRAADPAAGGAGGSQGLHSGSLAFYAPGTAGARLGGSPAAAGARLLSAPLAAAAAGLGRGPASSAASLGGEDDDTGSSGLKVGLWGVCCVAGAW
ncbi:MAG: kinase-like domain-containing protein [Monoraphidium minutum]|nr:MAG: kinase-like domain-containing protein [Monoraphidium minutum]